MVHQDHGSSVRLQVLDTSDGPCHINLSITVIRAVASGCKRGGDPRKSGVYKASAAKIFRKIDVKSTDLELQKTCRCTKLLNSKCPIINF